MGETLKNQLEILIRFWERSSEPWEVKDSQSRYIYANPRAHRFFPYLLSIISKDD